jgi:hypothetical protein
MTSCIYCGGLWKSSIVICLLLLYINFNYWVSCSRRRNDRGRPESSRTNSTVPELVLKYNLCLTH